MSLYTLDNQHVVIVGGSSGIGLATGSLANQLGAKVTLIGRDAEKLDRATQHIDGVRVAIADFSDETAISSVFADLPPIDHVYVAAGSFVGGYSGGQHG